MDELMLVGQIEAEAIAKLVEAYPDTVPDKVRDLDEQRLHTIPSQVRERGSGNAHLTRDELIILMDWKLAHGKFRPALKKLIRDNDAKAVVQTTQAGFQDYEASRQKSPFDPKTALATLTGLRGVGPATASLLLSVYAPSDAPFFSDELFRWCCWAPGPGNGWDREIKYNVKEYGQLFTRAQELKKRSGYSCLDLEKAAYVLYRQSSNSLPVEHEGKGRAAIGAGKKRPSPTENAAPTPEQEPKRTKKTSSDVANGSEGGTRRSTRQRQNRE